MDNKEILKLMNLMALERNLPKDLVRDAMETSMAIAYKRHTPELKEACIQASLDETGHFNFHREYTVHADDARLENPWIEIRLEDAQNGHEHTQIGDLYQESLPSMEMNRNTIRSFRQALTDNLNRQAHQYQGNLWKEKINSLVYGRIKGFSKNEILVEFEDNVVGIVPKNEQLIHERFQIGQRIPFALLGVYEKPQKGALLQLSRKANVLLETLFEQEVPEIQDGLIQIASSYRSQNYRTLIAVYSKQERFDPVSLCIGYQATRIGAVSDALNGERIQVLEWFDDEIERIKSAFHGMKLERIVQDGSQYWIGLQSDSDVRMAYHRYGPNLINLSKLLKISGLNAEINDNMDKSIEESKSELILTLESQLNVDGELAEVLVFEGFDSVETIAHVSLQELIELGLDEEQAQLLQDRAQEYLQNNWTSLENMPNDIWEALEKNAEVSSWNDLAECSTFDIVGIGGLTEEQAAMIIMEAREPMIQQMLKDEETTANIPYLNKNPTIVVQKNKIS